MSIGGRRDEVGVMFRFLAEENMQKSFPAKRMYFGEFFLFLLPSFSLIGIVLPANTFPPNLSTSPRPRIRSIARDNDDIKSRELMVIGIQPLYHAPPTTNLQR